MSEDRPTADTRLAAPFRLRDLGGVYLLTNHAGDHVFLEAEELERLTAVEHIRPAAGDRRWHVLGGEHLDLHLERLHICGRR